MSRTITTWTVTSPSGQILNANLDSLEPGVVMLSSKAGNHGQVTEAEWGQKLAAMETMGYRVNKSVVNS
jgi:hypothetical protein